MTKAEQPTITQSDELAVQAMLEAVSWEARTEEFNIVAQAFAKHRTTSLAAQDGLVEALKEARRSLKIQEGAEIWNSNCVECDGEGEWTECPICSDAFGKAIDARNATFPLIDAALSAIKGDKS